MALFSPPSIRRIESFGSACVRRDATVQPAVPPVDGQRSEVQEGKGGGSLPPQMIMSTSLRSGVNLLVRDIVRCVVKLVETVCFYA